MNIQQQNGIVSTIQFIPYIENDEYQNLRKSIFEQAIQASATSPCIRIDAFDETIMVFENYHHALHFLVQMFRSTVKLATASNVKIKLRSSLCEGSYFLHHDQIYGDAVNLATQLSCTSRENELRVCNIDPQVISDFIDSQHDVACYFREQDDNCVSISLTDADSTNSRINETIFRLGYSHQSKDFGACRNREIHIGRSDECEIYISGEHISRSHATLTIKYGDIAITDHSANGTYVYFDNREIYLHKDSLKLATTGSISCGRERVVNPKTADLISFEVQHLPQPRVSRIKQRS
jgi:hypothetical protein